MGLLLGGSVLTVCELLDLLIFNFIKKLTRRRDAEEKARQRQQERDHDELARRQKDAAKAVSGSLGPRSIYQPEQLKQILPFSFGAQLEIQMVKDT